MRGALGLVIGLGVGAGAMYLALVQPWADAAIPPPPADAVVVAVAPADAGAPAKKKRKRPRARVESQGGLGVVPGDNANLPTIDSSFGPAGAEDDTEGGYEETEPLAQLTSADRRNETRGDDVTLPPTKIDMEGGKEARKLDVGEISATIGSQAGGIRDCVIQGAINTDLSARISVQLVVGANGRVTKTRVDAPRYLLEKGLFNCVKSAAGRMKFPATGAATLVTVPVTLG